WTPEGAVTSMLMNPDGSLLYVGGLFPGGYAALDPSTGALRWRGTANGDVRALALAPNGDLLLGGAFTTVGGDTHRKLAAVNTVSSSSTAVGVTRNQIASVTAGSSTPDAWAPAKPCSGSSLFWDLTLSTTRVYAVGRNCDAVTAFDKATGARKFSVKANGDAQA